jgi:hypothetical protein
MWWVGAIRIGAERTITEGARGGPETNEALSMGTLEQDPK